MIGRRVVWHLIFLVAVLLSRSAPAASGESAQPNILFLFSDDQRADTIHALGNPLIKTPNLDMLVADGTAFTRAYIMGAMQGAVCVPSRACLMSGRSLFRVSEQLKDAATWPMMLRQAGYETFATGKWHNGPASCAQSFPQARSVFLGGMTDQFKVALHDVGPEGKMTPPRTEARNATEIFADEAIRFLRERKAGKPFALYVAFTSPHDPRTAPQSFHDLYDPANIPLPPNYLPQHPFDNGDMVLRDEKLLPWPREPEAVKREIANYYAMITHLDAQIGRILAELRSTDQHKNTLIVFAGDNGLALGSHGLLGKQNLYDHSMHVPLVLAGRGVPRGKRLDSLVYLLDLCPTLCEMGGAPAPPGADGRSLVPLLTGRTNAVRRVVFTAYRQVQRAVRDDRWKLIRYPRIDRTQLFDLQSDPFEMKDLSREPAAGARVTEMLALLAREQREYGDTAPLDVPNPQSGQWTPPPAGKNSN